MKGCGSSSMPQSIALFIGLVDLAGAPGAK
jgi:hypothetical protein